jgi:hypothetical protein
MIITGLGFEPRNIVFELLHLLCVEFYLTVHLHLKLFSQLEEVDLTLYAQRLSVAIARIIMPGQLTYINNPQL